MKFFHSFRLDTANHSLWRADAPVLLTPKAFDVLRYLVENAGRLVTPDEILEAVWRETYVNPEVVKKYILEIRKALGDSSEKPTFIQTSLKRGYQFIAPVRDDSVPPAGVLPETPGNVVGRNEALATLDGYFQSALRGRREVVFITGEAGIGKTTLVDLFLHRIPKELPIQVARGQCVEGFGGKEPYYPVLDAMSQLTRDGANGPFARVLAAKAPTWLVQFPTLFKPEQRDALHQEILGSTRERMVREACEAFDTLAATRPLIVILEDLHWVDSATLDFISALARRRDASRLLLLATYRPIDVVLSKNPLKGLKQDLLVHGLCREIALERLDQPEIEEYLEAQFGRFSRSNALADLIYRHCGGNALFMAAIVRELLKNGVLLQQEGAWSLTTDVASIDPALPETLQRMLEVQVEALAPGEQRVLTIASVAGERFSVETIAGVSGLETRTVEDVCEGLAERQQFIRFAGFHELPGSPAAAHYEFRHTLYRQAVYRGLSDVSRRRLHKDVGDQLSSLHHPAQVEMAAELALHFELGHDHMMAVEHLFVAAGNATRKFAYRDSLTILDHARGLASKIGQLPGARVQIRVLEQIGDVHYALGNMVESAKAFREAAALAAKGGLKEAEVKALTCLARTTVLMDADEGLALCESALRVCSEIHDPLLLARTRMLSANLHLGYDEWRREDAETCVMAKQTIRELTGGESPSHQEIWATHLQPLKGEGLEALRTAEAGISRYYEIWDIDRQALQGQRREAVVTDESEATSLVAYVLALSAKTVALLHLGRFGEALENIRTARDMTQKGGSNAWIFNLREAWLRLAIFDFAGARRFCDTIIETNPAYLAGQPRAMALIAEGYAALEAGDHGHALKAFQEVQARPAAKFFLHWYWRMRAQFGMAETYLAAGDLARADHEADEFLASALSTADPNLQVLGWEAKLRAATATNDLAKGQEFLQQALTILGDRMVPISAWRVHAAAWDLCLHQKNKAAAESHLAQAQAGIMALANSFPVEEPMRQHFLDAAPVRRVLEPSPVKRTHAARGPVRA